MLKLLLPAAVLVISSIVCSAQDIVTLTRSNPKVVLNPTDLVKIIGGDRTRSTGGGYSSDPQGYMTVAGNAEEVNLSVYGVHGNLVVPFDTMSGLTSIRLGKGGINGGPSTELPPADAFLVLQVTKQGQSLLSPPLVAPAAADRKYDVILETSTDMTNWAPTVPGEFLAASGQRFFRVRAVVK